jgi:hypothetical protein
MTTAQLQSLFPPGNCRPSIWRPGQHEEFSRLRSLAFDAQRQADRLWINYWWNDRPAAGTEAEAHAFQATDILLRLSGLLMLDAARVATTDSREV